MPSRKSSGSPQVHSEDGSKQDESTLQELTGVIGVNIVGGSASGDDSDARKRYAYCRVSSPKQKDDLSRQIEERTRTTKSSLTSGRDSTSREKVSFGWWTKSCEEMSSKLWFPTKTAFADSHSSSSSGYVERTERISWSKIKKYAPLNENCPRILWPSYMSSRAATTECDNTQTNDQGAQSRMRCQKIRLKPTAYQAKILRKWMKGARDTYNMALHLVKNGTAKPDRRVLKKLVVTSRDDDSDVLKRLKETPADIRVRAVMDLQDAYKTAYAGLRARRARQAKYKSRWNKKRKKKAAPGRRRWRKKLPFNVKFKSRRLTSDSFGFEPKSIRTEGKQLRLFSTQHKFGMRDPIRMCEAALHPIEACSRVQYTFGRWYLLLPYKAESPPTIPTERFVALDPGVRTFLTYYTEDEAGEVGVDLYDKIDKINHKVQSIEETTRSLRGKDGSRIKINRLRRALYRALARTSNLATVLHWKSIKFLLDSFDVVVSPRLNVNDMIGKDSNLRAITKRRLAFLSHGKFRERLLMKAMTRSKVVLNLEEHGTSRTCSRCGHDNKAIGASKTLRCEWCHLVIDRDLNASRNHALKSLFGKTTY